MLLRPITRPIRSYGHRLSSWESRQSFGETRKRLMTAHVQVFERRCARTLHARRRPASEKRQGTKSRREMFGGARPWFMCPVQSNGVYCGRRVTKLYGVGRLFACRHCYRLAYTSQQESARDRGLWLIQLAVAKSLFVSVLVSFEMVVFNFVKPRMSMATIPWISIFRFIPIWRSSLPQPVLLEV